MKPLRSFVWLKDNILFPISARHQKVLKDATSGVVFHGKRPLLPVCCFFMVEKEGENGRLSPYQQSVRKH